MSREKRAAIFGPMCEDMDRDVDLEITVVETRVFDPVLLERINSMARPDLTTHNFCSGGRPKQYN